MKKYECGPCGYIYDEAAGDPDNGIAPGTKWEDLPADWVCPVCGVGKEEFCVKNPRLRKEPGIFCGRGFRRGQSDEGPSPGAAS